MINAYAEKIPVHDAVFDIVCMRDSLHHIKEQNAALGEAVRILKPQGTIIIEEFNPRSIAGKGVYILERLLGEETKLVYEERLVKMLKDLSVVGQVQHISRLEYVFEGCKFEQN